MFTVFAGAFLIPFFVMLILEGIPLFLIELGIGQRMRLGSLGVWNTIHPWLGGIGISSCIVTLFVTLYYNVVITWCFFYLLNSFRVTYHFWLEFCSEPKKIVTKNLSLLILWEGLSALDSRLTCKRYSSFRNKKFWVYLIMPKKCITKNSYFRTTWIQSLEQPLDFIRIFIFIIWFPSSLNF